jgi:hypothetical protein
VASGDVHLSSRVKFVEAISNTAGASGTTPINGSIVDLSGFENIMFVAIMGPITAGALTSMKMQRDTDSAGGTMADITGSAQTISDTSDGQVFICDILRVSERYARGVISRGTQVATVQYAFYCLYGAREEPVTQPAGFNIERSKDSTEGTA